VGTKAKIAARIAAAIALSLPVVAYFEGRNLAAYLDPIGIPTICEGWTRGVRLGDVATEAECDEKTKKGLQEAADIFERWVPTSVVLNMDASTTAAFISFIYNVGPGKPGVKDGFVWLKKGGHSTMLRELRAGRIGPACAQLSNWVSAGGRKLRGLERRRAAERELCEAGL
jgi:lysozyme